MRLAVEEKVKPKTKGSTTAPMPAEPVTIIAGAQSKNDMKLRFLLDKRAYKTMKALFHIALSDTEDFPKAVLMVPVFGKSDGRIFRYNRLKL